MNSPRFVFRNKRVVNKKNEVISTVDITDNVSDDVTCPPSTTSNLHDDYIEIFDDIEFFNGFNLDEDVSQISIVNSRKVDDLSEEFNKLSVESHDDEVCWYLANTNKGGYKVYYIFCYLLFSYKILYSFHVNLLATRMWLWVHH